MEVAVYRLDDKKLNDFLRTLCRGREVFALEQSPPGDGPVSSQARQYHLVHAAEWQPDRHVLGSYRPVEPLKSLLFRPREFLGPLDQESGPLETRERIAIGVKNCDLSALRIHDHVFLEMEPVDPYYAQAREKTVIVSCDCTDIRETCFCPAVRERPYAKDGFDVNLSPTSTGLVVEAGSERGRQLLTDAERYLEKANESAVRERDRSRDELTRRLGDQAAAKGLTGEMDVQAAVQKTAESKLWETFAEDCVECGACNLICCTCHCFLLADGRTLDNSPARVKQWDSCLYRNFARVAGGANPRRHRMERLHNRFDKKFNFFPEILGRYACDGCGRCVEACTGKIDIRDVLKRAVDEL